MNTYLKWAEWYQIIDPEYFFYLAKLIYGCGSKTWQVTKVNEMFKDDF